MGFSPLLRFVSETDIAASYAMIKSGSFNLNKIGKCITKLAEN